MIIELVIFVVITLAVLLWLRAIADFLFRITAGEQGALMPRGFMPHGTRVRRAIELKAIISRLGLITRLNLPLATALNAVAAGERPRVRNALRTIGTRIRDGLPVSEALHGAFRGCPPQLTAALQRAEAVGQLAAALDQQEKLIGATVHHQFRSTPHMRHALGYALMMLLFCGAQVYWFMALVLPRYKNIFLDFDTELPKVTIALLTVSNWLANHVWMILAILALIGLPAMLTSAFTSVMTRPTSLTRIVAFVRRALPITRTLDYGLGMAKAIRTMTLRMRSGAWPAEDTNAGVIAPTNFLRTRWEAFERGVVQGTLPHKSAHDARLGHVFVCALRMVEQGEDPERALGHAAEYYETIAYRWWHCLVALSGPLITLALGIMVAFVALALFMPLIALINGVSETI